MYCRFCQSQVHPNAEVCVSCGCRPLAGDKYCQECGTETRPDQELCIECGTILSNEKAGKDTPYASFGLRAAAYLIDSVIMGTASTAIWFIFVFIVLFVAGFLGEEGALLGVFLYFGMYITTAAVSITYLIIMNASKWQGTVGKIAVGIKVVDMDGNRLTLAKSGIRYLGYVVSGLTMGVGFIIAAFTDKNQALHDMLAKTLVVKKDK